MSISGIRIKQLLLISGDYLVFFLALVLTILLRYGSLNGAMWDIHVLPFSLLGIPWILSYYIFGLYDLSVARDSFSFFRVYLEGMLANLVIAFSFFYLIPVFGIAPRTNLLLYFTCALLLGYAWRILFNRFLAPSLFQNRILYVGAAGDAVNLQKLLHASNAGFDIVAVVDPTGTTSPKLEHAIWKSQISDIDALISELHCSAIVVGLRPEDAPGLREALYRALFSSVSLLDRKELEETLTGRVPLEYVGKTWFLENLHEHDKAWYESAKRLSDILLTIPLGLITLALLPLIAILIKLSSKGPVFYSQIRVGKYGKPFKIWKFRTMVTDAEKNGPQFTASTKTDPRITSIGRLFRQLRIDELPQLWNVIRGDLSFIGPRPERPEFVAPIQERFSHYALRHLTRPGLTGWAQVKFLTPNATAEDNLIKLQYDLFYIKNRSILLDGAILLKTIGIVLRRQGT